MRCKVTHCLIWGYQRLYYWIMSALQHSCYTGHYDCRHCGMFWTNLFILMLQWLWYTVPEFNRLGKIQELYIYLTSLVLHTTKLVPCTQNWRCNIPKKWKITIKFSIWTQVLIFPQERNMGIYMNIATCKWGVLIFEYFVQCSSIEGLVHLYLSAYLCMHL